ncbi:hypothetical protein HU200_035528 [Digitaria exilis]|uniref:Uncharacterized protein n=1 Tax=Digitaria exilis TaxID=1010633 RepID=A0A835EIZ1_9POAL|nr:hypothetical protein HU200_035528 [Digitaria exilis]
MPLSCFSRRRRHGGAAGEPSPAPPCSSATSVYWTHLGAVTLTWSRAPIGLLLAAELLLAGEDNDGAAPARFELRPWLPWRRRGTKRFTSPDGRSVALSWDLSRARFAAAGRRPEPASRYSLLNAVVSAAGDGRHGGESYATTVVDAAGEAHEVSLGVEESAMWVAIDGEKALQVRRLRWKFRGSERLDLPGGRRVRVTWDLHGWLFSPADTAAAVFVLRFETSDDADEDDDDAEEEEARARTRWSGSDTSPSVSVASTSATSSASSVATVSEWAAAEEAAALKDGGGFSLVVKLWKKRR